MEKPKSTCDICKIKVDPNFMHKHLTSERHLRAKASKIFYQQKSKQNAAKKQKIEEDTKEQSHISHNRVKGIWVLIKDPCTNRVVYKNRLSGKTQSNKPIGLRDEDIEEENLQSIVIQDYEKIENGLDYEYEEPGLGEWQEVKSTSMYWFGGDDQSSEEVKVEEESGAEKIDREDERPENFRKINFEIQDLKVEPAEKSDIEITEQLRQQLESKDIDEEIIDKPEFKKMSLNSTFKKRSLKGKSLINK